MTDIDADAPRQSFGVLAVFGDTFSIFFKGFLFFTGTALLGQVLMLVVLGVFSLQGIGTTLSLAGSGFSAIYYVLAAVGIAVVVAIYSLTGAIISLGAFDMKMGNPVRFTSYVGTGVRNIIYIALCSIIFGILLLVIIVLSSLLVGLVARAIPLMSFVIFPAIVVLSLYVFGMFSVVNPAIVVEGAGMGALGRSFSLTKNYRWPIVGLYAIFFVVLVVVFMMFGAVLAFGGAGLLFTAESIGLIALVAPILNILVGAIMTGFMGVLFALVFARLKEIKEGFGLQNLRSVFD